MKRLLGTVALAVVSGVVFVVGLRTKSPTVLRAIRRTNRAVFNPRQMESAGTPGSYASIIRHVGRTTGRTYETPIQAVATSDGFVVGLPYGERADWLQNVLAAGTATLVHEGRDHGVDRPELVPMGAVSVHWSLQDQRVHRLFRVDQALRLRRVELDEGA